MEKSDEIPCTIRQLNLALISYMELHGILHGDFVFVHGDFVFVLFGNVIVHGDSFFPQILHGDSHGESKSYMGIVIPLTADPGKGIPGTAFERPAGPSSFLGSKITHSNFDIFCPHFYARKPKIDFFARCV